MDTQPAVASIHELAPLDQGGPTARAGLSYQDHVAVGFCVEMLSDGIIVGVWCELHDDVLLLCEQSGNRWVEFVQVKGERRDSYWSPATICERDKGKPGTSIVERQLAHARCAEPKRFRIITLTDLSGPLRVLAHPLASAARAPGVREVESLLAELSDRLKDYPGGASSLGFWVRSVLWEVGGAEEAVRATNRERLARFLDDRFELSAPDHVDAVYEYLYRVVEKSGRARVPAPYEQKKIPADRLLSEVGEKVSALKRPRAAAGGNPLSRALREMGLLDVDVEHAQGLRARYLAASRRQEFMLLRQPQSLYDGVKDALYRVRMSYLPASKGDSAQARHLRCFKALDELHGNLPTDGRPPVTLLQGMMYDLVCRGLHTFSLEGDS